MPVLRWLLRVVVVPDLRPETQRHMGLMDRVRQFLEQPVDTSQTARNSAPAATISTCAPMAKASAVLLLIPADTITAAPTPAWVAAPPGAIGTTDDTALAQSTQSISVNEPLAQGVTSGRLRKTGCHHASRSRRFDALIRVPCRPNEELFTASWRSRRVKPGLPCSAMLISLFFTVFQKWSPGRCRKFFPEF